MTIEEIEHPLIEARRLERTLQLARVVGALLLLTLGPLFRTTDPIQLVYLAVGLAAWAAVLQVLLGRARSIEDQRRLGLVGLAIDMAVVVYAMWIFSASPDWSIWTIGVLVIIGTAFRFGRLGAIGSAIALSIAYLAVSAYRTATYGFSTTPPLAAFHIIVYLLTALLLSGSLRELYRLRAQREFQYFHDLLTGLPNRTLLTERLQQALVRAQRSGDQTSLLVVDLNDFKAVNDGFGYDAGDELLREVGPRITTQLRQSDTIARLGGDEFAVLLPATDASGAIQVAEKIVAALELPFVLDGVSLDVGGSIGIVHAPTHAEDAEELFTRADIAMHAAKGSLSGYTVFSVDQDRSGAQRLAMTAELRRAIDGGELILYYQPLVDLRSGTITSVEALVRWLHPQRGLVAPDDFIPLAERTGLIKQLTRDVLSQAIRQARAWQLAGHVMPVGVNLSMRNVLDPQLAATVSQLLERWQAPAELLRLEITESVLAAEPERALATIEALRATGVRIVLDDFGTGYSSLAYLNRLVLDELKIDRSFVMGMATDDHQTTIVRAIVDLGHGLGYKVVAEGVEDSTTRDRLASLGCDVIQGFLVARPMPGKAVTPWLQQYGALAMTNELSGQFAPML